MSKADFITHRHLDLSGLRHGFFTRLGGVSEGVYASLNGGFGSKDRRDLVVENRRLAAEALGGSADAICGLYQSHSSLCHRLVGAFADERLEDARLEGARLEGDALVTSERGVTLVVLTADCVPVLLADIGGGDGDGVIGCAHAGWRGAVGGIIKSTVATMLEAGAKRETIRAVAGPCIQQASYQVGGDLMEAVLETVPSLADRFFVADSEAGRWRFDLPGYVVHLLGAEGIGAVSMAEDTYSDSRFFSHRRAVHASQADTGRLMSMIRLCGGERG